MSDDRRTSRPSTPPRAVVADATLTEINAFLLGCIVDDIVSAQEAHEALDGARWEWTVQNHRCSLADDAVITTSSTIASFIAVHAAPAAVQQAARRDRQLLLLIERRQIDGDAALHILRDMLAKYDTYEGFEVRWRNKIERALFGAVVTLEPQRGTREIGLRQERDKQGRAAREPARLNMPRVAGSPVLATKLVTVARLSSGAKVVIDGHSVVRFSPGFLRSLVDALAAVSPAHVLFDSGPPSWHQEARAAADAAGLAIDVRGYYPSDTGQPASF